MVRSWRLCETEEDCTNVRRQWQECIEVIDGLKKRVADLEKISALLVEAHLEPDNFDAVAGAISECILKGETKP